MTGSYGLRATSRTYSFKRLQIQNIVFIRFLQNIFYRIDRIAKTEVCIVRNQISNKSQHINHTFVEYVLNSISNRKNKRSEYVTFYTI